MAKVLKITKPDGTLHVVPLANKAFYVNYNKRQKADKKWLLEEITGEEAAQLPYRDENHVKPADATKALADKDKEIERLKALLAEKEEESFNEDDEHADEVDHENDSEPADKEEEEKQVDKAAAKKGAKPGKTKTTKTSKAKS